MCATETSSRHSHLWESESIFVGMYVVWFYWSIRMCEGCTVSGLVLVQCMCEGVYSQWSGLVYACGPITISKYGIVTHLVRTNLLDEPLGSPRNATARERPKGAF